MPNRTTRANLSNPPNLELTWIRSSRTALMQRLFAATDTRARSRESTPYFRSGRTVAQHRTDRVKAGNTGRYNVETQPADAPGFRPSSRSNARASATVTQTELHKEWPDELHILPACHTRASIATECMLRISQHALSWTLPAINSKRARWRTPRSR